ncbi:hypothetical protein K443DRAFT_339858 [Laccaria amethystina LaAM-08-1]|uniref:Transmembrane protein n=1 Tax=Laccaria amethystina LaAM-08-1 TaxID=1095629 RepID=A0A0C9XBF2_9AGAR|nr:hypothetical protein K443DRAFT_339858 [Laccaria amethystina LaAM-08-1]
MEPLHTSNSPTQDDPAMRVQVEDSTQYLESPSVCFTASDTTKASWLKWSNVFHAVIQVAGLITAIVFGVWAVKTYGVARNSLLKADTANNLTIRSVDMANTANDLTKQALDIANFGIDLSLLALDIAQDANKQAREIADIMIDQTKTSHAIARAANHQALKIARTSHHLTRQALAIALDAKKQAGKIANTTNDLTRTSLAIANTSNHQTLAQNRLANSLQLLSFCGTMPHNLLRNQTDQCASITSHLWAFVTSSVVPTTPTPTTTSSGIALSRIVSAVSSAVHNLSTSTSSTPPRTTTTMSSSLGFQLIASPDGQLMTTSTSPTRPSPSTSPTSTRPSPSTSPTSMRPAASTQQITVRPSVSTPPTPPSTTVGPSPKLASHRRKKTMQPSVIIGIVVPVAVFFMAVGALIARRKGYISRCG